MLNDFLKFAAFNNKNNNTTFIRPHNMSIKSLHLFNMKASFGDYLFACIARQLYTIMAYGIRFKVFLVEQ